jgi:hypothetical protein
LDTGGPQVGAHAFRQHDDAAFGRAVWRDTGPGELALHRSDIDDLAAASRYHAPGNPLTDEECARQVGRHQVVPVLETELDERFPTLEAGVVDEDVRGAPVVFDGGDTPRRRRPGR